MANHKHLIISNLIIDTEGCRVYKDDIALALTAREFGLLRYLAENPNKIISKEHLYEQVWGEDSIGCDNTVMVHIRRDYEASEGN